MRPSKQDSRYDYRVGPDGLETMLVRPDGRPFSGIWYRVGPMHEQGLDMAAAAHLKRFKEQHGELSTRSEIH